MTNTTESQSLRSAATLMFASVGGILYWGGAFYLSNLPWLLVVSVPPAASRMAFSLWQERVPGLVWTAIELGVLVFRFGLVIIVIGLARGSGGRVPGIPVNWMSDVLTAVDHSLSNWPVVLCQLLIIGVIILVLNASISLLAVPSLADHIGEETAQAVSFAFKNLVVIPMGVIYFYAVFVRQFA